jgi:GTP pyrophosphokinase
MCAWLLIKLAERTCAIRAVKGPMRKRQRVAREVFDIYAPTGPSPRHRPYQMGAGGLSFRYLEPEKYKQIAKSAARAAAATASSTSS